MRALFSASDLKDRDLRTAIESDGPWEPTDPRIHIERSAHRLKQPHIVFIHTKGHVDGPKKWEPDLTTVRMASQHQIEFYVAEPFDPRRVVHQEDILRLSYRIQCAML